MEKESEPGPGPAEARGWREAGVLRDRPRRHGGQGPQEEGQSGREPQEAHPRLLPPRVQETLRQEEVPAGEVLSQEGRQVHRDGDSADSGGQHFQQLRDELRQP